MITQVKVLMFLFLLNVVSFVVLNATAGDGSPFVPGVQYSQPLSQTANVTQYEEQFNATGLVEDWDIAPEIGIPLFGDIFYTATEFVKQFRFLIDGFAVTFDWMAGFIPATGGAIALSWIAFIIRSVGAIFGVTLVFEIISGRRFLP